MGHRGVCQRGAFNGGQVVVKALVIIDMLDDFVDGALANPRARAIVPPLQRLLEHARRAGWVVVFSNDAHQPGDPELKVWGEHAMAGSAGAQVISDLEPRPGARELISPKRAYGAFDGTGLDEQLRGLGVDEVVLAGQHTHICVRHSSYGALIRGYEITIPADAVCAFEGVDENDALDYLRDTYAARITSVGDLVRAKAEAHTSA
jgi:nicotinamidase-related amidase